MDDAAEVRKFKLLLVVVLAFLASAYFSFKEMRYAFWGKAINARLLDVQQATGNRGRKRIVVEYEYVDGQGTVRRERDELSRLAHIPVSEFVEIQYVPGVEDSSRLTSSANWYAVYIFLAMIVALIVAIVMLWKF
ncbi:MAG TPA: hypothetical protein VHB77_17735, partial [Planctomycetaceae bacterium]|nr:hypothetical protein [Planctomycetaceae bacterium]